MEAISIIMPKHTALLQKILKHADSRPYCNHTVEGQRSHLGLCSHDQITSQRPPPPITLGIRFKYMDYSDHS